MSGSYKNHPYRPQDAQDAPDYAEPGVATPFVVVVVAFLGLVLLPFRRQGISTVVLALGSVIVLIVGGLSLLGIVKLEGLEMTNHLAIGLLARRAAHHLRGVNSVDPVAGRGVELDEPEWLDALGIERIELARESLN